MKNIYLNLLFILFLFSGFLCAQSPEGINYQVVLRDNAGSVIANTPVEVSFQIIEGETTGTVAYTESIITNTNGFGLINHVIGTGFTNDDFSAISWGAEIYFLKVLVTINNQETDLGTTQFVSVPYSLHSATSQTSDSSRIAFSAVKDSVIDDDASPFNEIQTLSILGQSLSISDGNIVTLPVEDADADPNNEIQTLQKTGNTIFLSPAGGSVFDDVDDADADPLNEIQTLSVSGNTLFISQGNGVSLPEQTLLSDNDDDTQIQVEKFFDEDVIRFDVAAFEAMTIASNGQISMNNKLRIKAPFTSFSEMIITNDESYTHSNSTQSFGFGNDPWIVGSRESSSETSGIYADGNYTVIWNPGDFNSGAGASGNLFIVDEDSWFDGDANPYNNGAVRAYLNTGGLWQISNRNQKQNIQPLTNALGILAAMKGYRYEFKLNEIEQAKGDEPMSAIGVMAQDLEEMLPEAVNSNGQGEYWVNYAQITPVLIEGVKEQQAQIEALQAKVAELETQLQQMQNLEERLNRIESSLND